MILIRYAAVTTALLLSAASAVAANGDEPAKPGLWAVSSSDSRVSLRSLSSRLTADRGSSAKGGIGSVARKYSPVKVPSGSSRGSLNLVLMLKSARASVKADDTFLFVFGKGSFWDTGSGTASHPADFVIVPFEVKDGQRKAPLDDNGMFKSEIITDFTVEEISPTEFRVGLPPKMRPGEYAWVYVAGGPPKSRLRVFDFEIKK